MLLNNNYLCHRDKKLIIIWQAKAANTIVVKMFLEQENLLQKAYDYSNWIHDYKEKIYNTEEKKGSNLFNDNETRFLQFTVNPYRFI